MHRGIDSSNCVFEVQISIVFKMTSYFRHMNWCRQFVSIFFSTKKTVYILYISLPTFLSLVAQNLFAPRAHTLCMMQGAPLTLQQEDIPWILCWKWLNKAVTGLKHEISIECADMPHQIQVYYQVFVHFWLERRIIHISRLAMVRHHSDCHIMTLMR